MGASTPRLALRSHRRRARARRGGRLGCGPGSVPPGGGRRGGPRRTCRVGRGLDRLVAGARARTRRGAVDVLYAVALLIPALSLRGLGIRGLGRVVATAVVTAGLGGPRRRHCARPGAHGERRRGLHRRAPGLPHLLPERRGGPVPRRVVARAGARSIEDVPAPRARRRARSGNGARLLLAARTEQGRRGSESPSRPWWSSPSTADGCDSWPRWRSSRRWKRLRSTD